MSVLFMCSQKVHHAQFIFSIRNEISQKKFPQSKSTEVIKLKEMLKSPYDDSSDNSCDESTDEGHDGFRLTEPSLL